MVCVIHQLGREPLTRLKDPKEFPEIVEKHLEGILSPYLLSASLDVARLEEAHYFWMSDLERVGDSEYDGGHESLDHFKHAAHLAYWLRRSKPVIDLNQSGEFPSGADLSAGDAYEDEYRFLYSYCGEYLAFDIGYHIALFYEINAIGSKKRLIDYIIHDWDFIEAVCYFLNAKNVSPHAMNMVYRAMFLDRGYTS